MITSEGNITVSVPDNKTGPVYDTMRLDRSTNKLAIWKGAMEEREGELEELLWVVGLVGV